VVELCPSADLVFNDVSDLAAHSEENNLDRLARRRMMDYNPGRNFYEKYRRVRLRSVGYVCLRSRSDHLQAA
jgi:hypothetical protein